MPCFAITAGHSCKQAGAALALTLGKGRPKLNAVLRTREVGPKGECPWRRAADWRKRFETAI